MDIKVVSSVLLFFYIMIIVGEMICLLDGVYIIYICRVGIIFFVKVCVFIFSIKF